MKIDYEITVNVEGLSHEEKKSVQDAFFKLGISWWGGEKYSCLDEDCYTNTKMAGLVTQNLMWSDTSMKPTHTIEELFKLAGKENEMKPEKNLKPFDLEKALDGGQVVTRGGKEVTQITLFECDSRYPLCAVLDGYIYSFTKDGLNSTHERSVNDLFMKQKTHIVNGFEVPAPETKAPDRGVEHYLPEVIAADYYASNRWYGADADNRILSRNILFLTKEDAIANAKAMLGINPYEE